MSYYYSKTIQKTYEEAHPYLEEKLKDYGFGIVSELEMHKKFKEKLNVDFRPYKILGACSPKHAFEAVSAEEHIGLMLPCNVVVQEAENGKTLVSAIDPVASMQAVENKSLDHVAEQVKAKLQKVIASI